LPHERSAGVANVEALGPGGLLFAFVHRIIVHVDPVS
jgi:hypothetical protein